MPAGLKRAIWILNTLGLLFYLGWLYSMGDRQILRSQDGIMYFLPCIPFFFVYMLLINPKPRDKTIPWWQHKEEEPPRDATPPPSDSR